MKNRWKYIVPALVILALASVVAIKIISSKAAIDTRRQNAPIVRVEKPTRETVTYSLSFTGDVVAIQQATVVSKVSGNLDRIYVDIGTHVERDQILALIDTTELHQQFQQASATYQNALSTQQRTKELFEQNLVAKQDLDNADAAMKVSRAAFETAATHLAYARITAPFAGFVTRRYLDPGAMVNPGTSPLFTLMDLELMKIIVNILEKDIPVVNKGKKAVINVDAYPGKQFLGTVSRYAEAVDPSTRTMAVEIDIPNKDHDLKPGMFANVVLTVREHPNAITLPTQAILSDEKGTYVLSAVDNMARRLPVTIGEEQRGKTEILSGLSGEESIITTGQQFAKDGAAISVQQ